MNNAFRILAIMGLMMACLTGCTTKTNISSPAHQVAPWGGADLNPGDYEILAIESARRPIENRSWWGLPLVSRKYLIETSDDGQSLAVSDYSMIGLGIPYAYLPLQFSFTRYNYESDQTESTGRVKRRYWPWYSWASTRGDVDGELEAELFGIPLLFEYGRESGPIWYFDDFNHDLDTRQSFSFWSALWWIGPVHFDSTTTGTRENGDPYEIDAQYFFPLFLGRGPGAIVWYSQNRTETEAGQRVNEIAHGPLLGYAGWIDRTYTLGPRAGDHTRLLLGGLLWYDGASGQPGSSQRNRTVGPLWGLVGTTIRDGRSGISLLRLN